MQTVSFKKFSNFLDLREDPSDQQIHEIFGLFKNNDKIDQLKKKREELKAKQDAAKKELQKKKDADFAAARDKIMNKQPSADKPTPASGSGRTSLAAQGKRNERDWITNMESIEDDFDK